MDKYKMIKKLQEIIDYVYNTSPYYINRGDHGEYGDISILRSTDYDAEKLLSIEKLGKYRKKDLMRTYSSGSTGKCKEILWDKNDYIRSMQELWIRRKSYYGISSRDKVCYFYSIPTDINLLDESEIYSENSLGFSKTNLSKERLKDIYVKMAEFKPKWLLLQPSIGNLLSLMIMENNLDAIPSIEYIEYTGEILTGTIRENTKAAFNCKIANQYGANELNSIAYECPYGNMHLMESNVYVEEKNIEEIDSDNNTNINANNNKNTNTNNKELIVTSLTNKTIPLIKYQIGDYGKICDENCKCGNKAKILKLSSGRTNDYILLEDGNKTTSYIFVKIVDFINMREDTFGDIKQFYIEQNDINEFKVKLYVDSEASYDEIVGLFMDLIDEDRLMDAKFTFEFVTEYMMLEDNGKFKYFKRNF